MIISFFLLLAGLFLLANLILFVLALIAFPATGERGGERSEYRRSTAGGAHGLI